MTEEQLRQLEAILQVPGGVGRSPRIDLDLSPLRQRLGASKTTIYLWQRGSRPQWRFMRRIADILTVPLPEVVQALWRENVGDPCPCGCGGKKTFPEEFPRATTLAIEIPCAQCGLKRIRRRYGWDQHHKLCPACRNSVGRVERIPFTCVGYWDHDATRPRYATNCRKTRLLAPWQVTKRRRQAEHGQRGRAPNSRFNVSKREYQCAGCSNSERLIALTEEKELKFHAKIKPHQNVPRIRSRKQRLELQRAYSRQMNPNFKPPAHKSGAWNSGRVSPDTTRHLLIRAWSGKELPKSVRLGLCRFCGKLARTTKKAPDFHKSCYLKWLGTPQGARFQSLKTQGLKVSLPPSGPGRPMTEESLKISYAWSVQHYIAGKSYRTIAEEHHINFTSVRGRIRFLIDKLPDPSLLGSRFQRAVRLLLDASRATP